MSGGKDLDLDIGRVNHATPAEAPNGAEAASAVAPVASGDTPSSGVDEITRALAAGEIDAARAQEMLIDQVTSEQLPPDASPELAASIRSEVAALLAEDPTLQALLNPHEG